ncbi:TRAP transporter small permease [Halobellus rarus]|uniref:TRAP transporter small permease n=1 Tax=Halobellus rarus TaxID=1126237 RepID=A0ABD6CLV0_9EURY|nr:TRAP transporter small permease subunit [Halobellus rarus]
MVPKLLRTARVALDPDREPETRLGRIERDLELYVGGSLLVIYGLLIGLSVIQRTLTGEQALWVQEITIGMFVWVAWLSVAYVIRNEDHLRFTLVLSRLSNRGRYLLYWVEWALWVGFAGTVFVYSVPVLGDFIARQATITGTSIPDAVTYLAITVGFGLVLLRVAQQAVSVTLAFRRGDDVTHSEGEVVAE